MAQVKIRVGAAVDAGMASRMFEPIVAASKRAKAAVDAQWGKPMPSSRAAGRGGGGASFDGGYRDNYRDHIKWENAKAAETLRIQRDMVRERRAIERADAREASRNQRIADAAALRVSGGAVRNVAAVARKAGNVGSDLARGAGLDLSLGNALQKRQSLETAAVALSNAGYMPGDKRNAQRVDPRALMEEAQNIGIATGTDAGDALAGLTEFVGKTGDLATGRAVMADLAKLSKATGTNLTDMVAAAGDVSSGLGDMANKGPTIVGIMTTFAAQGKEGAVEIRHLATQMAKLAAGSGAFGGNREGAFSEMGVLAQMARQRGGAVSAQGAATALSSFVATFDKGARNKAFEAEHVKTRNKDGTLRSAEDIIVDSLKATGGDSQRMGKMFMDVQARRVTKGWEAIYREAGGGDAGIAAVKKRFAELRDSKVEGSELSESFSRAMGTGASQAQVLKNRIEKSIGDELEKAAPKLMQAGDMAGKAAVGLAKIVSWAAQNPMEAVTAALVGSVAKSFAGEVMRASIERAIGRAAAGAAVSGAVGTRPPTPGGPGMSAFNTAASAFTIMATAVALYSAGKVALDEIIDTSGANKDAVAFGVKNEEALQDLRAARDRVRAEEQAGVVSPEAAKQLAESEAAVRRRAEETQQRIAEGIAFKESDQGAVSDFITKAGLTAGGFLGIGPGAEGYKRGEQSAADLTALQADLTAMNGKLGGTLQVRVTNMPAAPPGVPQDGRTSR